MFVELGRVGRRPTSHRPRLHPGWREGPQYLVSISGLIVLYHLVDEYANRQGGSRRDEELLVQQGSSPTRNMP